MSIVKSERVQTRIEYLEEGILEQDNLMQKAQDIEDVIIDYKKSIRAAETEKDSAEFNKQEAESALKCAQEEINSSIDTIEDAKERIASISIARDDIIEEATLAICNLARGSLKK